MSDPTTGGRPRSASDPSPSLPPMAPPSAPPPPPSTAPVLHPEAPSPPRSRRGAHVLSVMAGLLVTPMGIAALAGGSHGISHALARSQDPTTAALVAVGAGVLLLGIVAASAAGSSLGALVGGTLFGVGLGLAFLLEHASTRDAVRSAVGPAEDLIGPGVRLGLVELGRTGQLLLLGLTLALVGLAVHLARRGGRRAERVEARLAAAQSVAQAPTPPRSRLVAHVIAAAAGLLATPVALGLLATEIGRLRNDLAPSHTLVDLLLGAAGVGALVLAGVVLAAGWSSFGLAAGGTLWGVVPGMLGVLDPASTEGGPAAVLTWVGEMAGPSALLGVELLATRGTLLAWGVVAALGGLAAHAARLDGARRERVEITLAAASAPTRA